jgi:hypothetical protein
MMMGRPAGAAVFIAFALLAGGCTSEIAPSALPSVAVPILAASPFAVATLTVSPDPTPVATMAPPPPELVTVEPVEGTTLPIAGRDGAPGLVSCGRLRPTTLDAIFATPAGAERLVGQEYDVLRATIERYGTDAEFGFRGETFREFRLDETSIVFLGSNNEPEGPYSHIDVAFMDGRWDWAGMSGGCRLTGEPGPEWGAVNWTLDPAFDAPTAKTRTLHLLATDYECVGDARLRGRLAPAWVFLYPKAVLVQLFATRVEPDAECTDQKPLKVTLRLPEPLGSRELVDANPEPCRGCGG